MDEKPRMDEPNQGWKYERYMDEKPRMDEPNQGWKYGWYMDEKPRMDEPNWGWKYGRYMDEPIDDASQVWMIPAKIGMQFTLLLLKSVRWLLT